MFNKFRGKRPYARFLGTSQMQIKQCWRRYSKKNGKKYIQYTPLRPLEWTRNKIIGLLKERPKTTVELSNELLLTLGGVNPHLNFLQKDKKIKSIYYKNKKFWEIY